MTSDDLVKMLEDSSTLYKELVYKENSCQLFYKKYKYCVYFHTNNYALRCLLYRKDKDDLQKSDFFKNNKKSAKMAAGIFDILEKYKEKYRKRVDSSMIAVYSNETSIFKEILDLNIITLASRKPVAISSVSQCGKIYRKKSGYSYRVVLKDKSYNSSEIKALIHFYEKNKEFVKFSPKLAHRVFYCDKKNIKMWIHGAFVDIASEKLLYVMALMLGDNIKQKLEIVNSPHNCKV